MGVRYTIRNLSRLALFAAMLLSIAAVSSPASAESNYGERGYGEVYRGGHGYNRYYAPADRYYDGRTYRRVVPRQHYLHRSKPWRGVRNPSGRFRLHQPYRHGRGIERRAFRHDGRGIGRRAFRHDGRGIARRTFRHYGRGSHGGGFRLRYHRY